MSSFSIPTLILIAFLFSPFKLLSAEPSSFFSFTSFDKDSNFESVLALYGDAKVVNGSSLQSTSSAVSFRHGGVMRKNPIKVFEGNRRDFASFSSYLSFLISPDGGHSFGFVMVTGFLNISMFENSTSFMVSLDSENGNARSKFLVVEFDSSRDGHEQGNLSKIQVGINVGRFAAFKNDNLSDGSVLLNSGTVLHSWIDYEAGSMRLEVRLSQFGDSKPVDPLVSYPIDLLKLWNEENVFVGLTSSNRNPSESSLLYSWSFSLRHFPHWLHSQPLDPHAVVEGAKVVVVRKRGDCFARVIAAMFIGIACGAFGAFAVLYLWTIFGNKRPVVPVECSVDASDFKYKEVEKVVVADEVLRNGKQ